MSLDSDAESPNSKRNMHSQETSGESGGFTRHVQEFSGESSTVPKKREQINIKGDVQFAFLLLLRSLCIKAGNLSHQWFPGCRDFQSKTTLGKASITAIPDGRLIRPSPTGCVTARSYMLFIIETKTYPNELIDLHGL